MEFLNYLAPPGRLLMARRRMGGWLRDHDNIKLHKYDFWTSPGDTGIILRSWLVNSGSEIKKMILIKDVCVVFCCEVTKFNFDWKSISEFLDMYLC